MSQREKITMIVEPEVYPIEVDYSESLGPMLLKAGFDSLCPYADELSVSGEGLHKLTLKIVAFTGVLHTKKVIERIRRKGYTFAKPEHLLAFWRKFGPEDKFHHLIALGNIHRYTPGLGYEIEVVHNYEYRLNEYSLEVIGQIHEWETCCQFLIVCPQGRSM